MTKVSTRPQAGATLPTATPVLEPELAAQVAPEPAEGLTVAQFETVLEVIAGRTATLHRLVMLSNDPCQDEFVRDVCGDAAEALATAIGAMADDAVGGQIIGNANRWHYGPNFADAGKGGAA